MCMNENLDAARESCCNVSSTSGSYMCKFSGERVKYSTNEERCQESMPLGGTCDWSSINEFGDGCGVYDGSNWHWTNQACEQKIKGRLSHITMFNLVFECFASFIHISCFPTIFLVVRDDGMIAIVHEPFLGTVIDAYSVNNTNFFKVDWISNAFPTIGASVTNTSCGESCEVIFDGCLW